MRQSQKGRASFLGLVIMWIFQHPMNSLGQTQAIKDFIFRAENEGIVVKARSWGKLIDPLPRTMIPVMKLFGKLPSYCRNDWRVK